MTLQPGDLIEGKYRIVRLLGEGGMGSVYEGENVRIHRRVAIKVLHAAVAAKADVVQRFEREAQAAGRIGSEHIVEVLDLGNLPSGERFMVMEFLEGESLGDRIKKRKRLAPQETAPIVHQLLEGLAAAHQAGIIHRDLKPDNVYLCTKGQQREFVKVLDFGVSKFSALDGDMSMTKTGAVMGTPFYMSPEQARGGKIDLRSDLYSVGVVVYQAVTGRVPFHAETFNELVFKIALESPEPAELVAPGLDQHFAQIIARAMMRDANLRFQSAREFQAALAQWMQSTAGAAMNPGFQSSPHVSIPGGAAPWGNASQSGPYPQQLAQSGANLHQSGPGLGQSGGPHPLAQSALGGLAMTSPQKSNSGAVIAGMAIAACVIGGGALVAYKFFGARGPSVAAAQPTSAPVAQVESAKPAAPPPAPATAEKPPAPEAATAPAAPASASAEAEAEPASTTSAAEPPPVHGQAPGGHAPGVFHPGGHGAAPKPPPTSAPAAKPAGGRAIGGDL
ncbi:MAG TPA: serine/threonine-protein kinase [Minicystis sp.]|nr:serine/threonine-protein kinase [Minicystis sp.]